MSLISVTEIGSVHRIIEMRRALIAVVAASIDVIEMEADADPFTCISSELCCEMIFAVRSVARIVVAEVRERGKGIGEMELLRLFDEEVIRLGENELISFRAVNIDAIDAQSSQVSSRVEFSTQTSREDGIHEHVGECVGGGGSDISKPGIDGPYFDPLRDLLV